MIKKGSRVIYPFFYKGEEIKIVGTITKVYIHKSGIYKAVMVADDGQPLKECEGPITDFEVIEDGV